MSKSAKAKSMSLLVILLTILIISTIFVACNKTKTDIQQTDEWGEWIVQKQPTCTEDGLRYREKRNGERQEEVLEALGHDFGEWQVITEATTTSDGLKERHCSRCDETEQEVIGAIVDGTQGLEYTYHTSGDAYYITGSGTAFDVKNLVVPSKYKGKKVWFIYQNSLNDMPNLETVKFAENSECVSIYNDVFNNCKKLRTIEIPASISTLTATFAPGCDLLEEVIVDSNSTYFTSVDGIVYDKNITKLVYYPRAKAGEYTFPDTVDISKTPFWLLSGNARKLTTINVSANQSKYKSIDGVLYDTSVASGDCYNLLAYPGGKTQEEYKVYFDDTHHIRIGTYAFYQHEYIKKVIYKGFGWRSYIGEYAFAESSVEHVVFQGEIDEIKQYAFYDCNKLKLLDFTDVVELSSMMSGAFYDCTALTSVELPSNFCTAGIYHGGAFAGCTSLENITISADSENFKTVDGILLSKDGAVLYEYPNGKKGNIVLPSSVKSIENYMAFLRMDNDEIEYSDDGSIYLGDILISARTVSSETFAIKEGTKFIAGSGVVGIKSKKIVIPQSVIGIGYFAFGSVKAEIEFVENNVVEYIGQSAFTESNASVVNLPNATYIGEKAFYKCNNLKQIILGIGGNKTFIGDRAFADYKTVIEKLVLGANVQTVEGSGAFYSSNFVAKITDVYIESADIVNKTSCTTDLLNLVKAENLYILNGMSLTDTGRENLASLTAYSFYYTKVADNVIINGKSYTHYLDN